jgi:hypothetical protein
MNIRKIQPGKGIIVLLLSVLMAISACKKVEDPFDYVQLIGKWEMVSENCKEYMEGELLLDETRMYVAGQTFFEFRSDGTGATFDQDRIVVEFGWTRNGNLINIDTEDTGLFESFTIQALDQEILEIRAEIEEDMDPEMEYLSFCDYSLTRAPDSP